MFGCWGREGDSDVPELHSNKGTRNYGFGTFLQRSFWLVLWTLKIDYWGRGYISIRGRRQRGMSEIKIKFFSITVFVFVFGVVIKDVMIMQFFFQAEKG